MNIHSVFKVLFKVYRGKRMEQFERLLEPGPDDDVLDVGGNPASWTTRPQLTRQIDCVNIEPFGWDASSAPDHRISNRTGDGCALEFAEGSYSILFSNSVIEHVGDWQQQSAFAAEVRRVGRKLWIQTPAFECPLEPHFLAPFVHWLPVSIRRHVVRWLTPWGWITRSSQQQADTLIEFTRLLTKRQVKELFPDCEILTERMFWIFPKSYIAYRLDSSPANADAMEETEARTSNVKAQPTVPTAV